MVLFGNSALVPLISAMIKHSNSRNLIFTDGGFLYLIFYNWLT